MLYSTVTYPLTESKYYFTGKPCKRGHIAMRQTSNKGCVPCLREKTAASYRDNSAKWKAYALKSCTKNRVKRRARWVEWRKKNSEREKAKKRAVYATDPKKHYAMAEAWRRANPAADAAHSGRRYARKRNAPGRGITGAEWKQVLDDSLGLCAYCNERKPLTLDHIEPLIRGGEHDIENATTACRSCNPSKGDTPLLLWLARKKAG